MLSSTHVRGGMLFSVIGFTLLSRWGLLLDNVSPFLQFLVMYPYVLWGSKLSDFDHGILQLPSKDYASVIVWHILHVFDFVQGFFPRRSKVYRVLDFFRLKHRSFATHSDVTVFVLWLLFRAVSGYGVTCMGYRVGYGFGFGEISRAICLLFLMGIMIGVASHIFLDLLTPSGVYFFIWTLFVVVVRWVFRIEIRKRVSLVPDTKYFATGGVWEKKINRLVNGCTWLSILWVLYIMYSPVRFVLGGYVL